MDTELIIRLAEEASSSDSNRFDFDRFDSIIRLLQLFSSIDNSSLKTEISIIESQIDNPPARISNANTRTIHFVDRARNVNERLDSLTQRNANEIAAIRENISDVEKLTLALQNLEASQERAKEVLNNSEKVPVKLTGKKGFWRR